jgi:anti-anti-sigma factor
MAELSFDVNSDGPSRTVIAVAGEVDMATATQLEDSLLDHRNTDVLVDLSRVGFLDSSGVSALVRAYKALRDVGHTLRTTGEQDHVLKVLEVSGLAGIFHAADARPAE